MQKLRSSALGAEHTPSYLRTPDAVASRIKELREEIGLSGVLMEPNVGGLMSPEQLDNSIRLFGQEVAPQLGS